MSGLLETRLVVLAHRVRVVGVLRLLSGVVRTGCAVRVEGRTWGIFGISGRRRRLLAGLVRLTRPRGVVSEARGRQKDRADHERGGYEESSHWHLLRKVISETSQSVLPAPEVPITSP